MAKAKVLKNINTMKSSMQQMIKEILKIISKEEIEKIARDVGFVQRQGKIQAWEFLYLCAFSGLDVSKNTLVAMSANLNSKIATEVSTQAIRGSTSEAVTRGKVAYIKCKNGLQIFRRPFLFLSLPIYPKVIDHSYLNQNYRMD
ncbi:hypothetical protein [Marinisporobacter balticus]|uniref:Uncharacterized protein n=1 Tax=Marinisporobacter balticus TaxID=2018667 RepID=A0A4R2KDM4_9FIRM|nr:hypothetical protein [Marinisporobacter balticus]TCO70422.1 hypothetical protein EV214_12642 [Marinisporobacter balticus]